MATPFKFVKCFIDNTGSRVVYWAFNKLYPYNNSAVLQVEYSQTGDQWQKISPDMKNNFFFVDTVRTNYQKVDRDYYRLRYTVSNSQSYVSKPVPAGYRLPKRQFAILKNTNRLAYKEMDKTGRKGLLLKRKTFGPPCTKCKHFGDDMSVNEHCPQCLGTGIVGGYYPGIVLPILPQNTQQTFGVLPVGYSQGIITKARTVAFNYLQQGDIWVDDITNQRYNIDQITIGSSFKHIPTIYMLNMHLIETTDAVHDKKADQLAAPKNVQLGWLEEFRVL